MVQGVKAGISLRKCLECGNEFRPVRENHSACSKSCRVRITIKTQGARKASTAWVGRSWETFFKHLVSQKSRKQEGLTWQDLAKLYEDQAGLCALSGLPLTRTAGQGYITTNASIDRIQASGSYTKGNIRLVCRGVNEIRSNFTTEQFVTLCTAVSEHMKGKTYD